MFPVKNVQNCRNGWGLALACWLVLYPALCLWLDRWNSSFCYRMQSGAAHSEIVFRSILLAAVCAFLLQGKRTSMLIINWNLKPWISFQKILSYNSFQYCARPRLWFTAWRIEHELSVWKTVHCLSFLILVCVQPLLGHGTLAMEGITFLIFSCRTCGDLSFELEYRLMLSHGKNARTYSARLGPDLAPYRRPHHSFSLLTNIWRPICSSTIKSRTDPPEIGPGLVSLTGAPFLFLLLTTCMMFNDSLRNAW